MRLKQLWQLIGGRPHLAVSAAVELAIGGDVIITSANPGQSTGATSTLLAVLFTRANSAAAAPPITTIIKIMRDDTGKWLTASELIKILQQLPPNSRIYPNQVQELSVVHELNGVMEFIGMIDFNFGEYESFESLQQEPPDA